MKPALFRSQLLLSLLLCFSCAVLYAQMPLLKQWDKTFGGTSTEIFTSLQKTTDGGYILGGHSKSNIGGDKTQDNKGARNYWVIKLDGRGIKQWDKTFGGIAEDYLTSVKQTSDGGYILGGYSYSPISGDKTETNREGSYDYWIVKLDAGGNKQWDKTFGGSRSDQLHSLQQTQDGGYILGGHSQSNAGYEKTENNKGYDDYWIVKLDANGNKQWDKTIGGSSDDKLASLHQTLDGGYVLGGWSTSPVSGDKTQASRGYADYWIVKLNANGNKQWDKTLGGSSDDILLSLQQTEDGGYILGGTSDSPFGGDKTESGRGIYDYWLVKLDEDGTKQWDKTLGGSGVEYFGSVQQTPDGGYVLGGSSASPISGEKTESGRGSWDYWLVKLNASGNKQWDKTIGGNNTDYLISVEQTLDGGLILGGWSYSPKSGDKSEDNKVGTDYWTTVDFWIVKLGKQGDKTIGGSGDDYLTSLQQTSDGGYILGGASPSPRGGDKTDSSKGDTDYWVVKLDANGNKIVDKTFGGSGRDDLMSLQQTSDGGFILGGYSFSGISGDKTDTSRGIYDYWVIKLDAAGNKQGDKTLGGSSIDYLSSVQQTRDGGYILGGRSLSDSSGDKSENSKGGYDYWVVKLDALGNKQADKTIGGSGFEDLSSLQQTADGGYILGGWSASPISGDKSENNKGGFDYWVVKLDAAGNKQWDKTLGGSRDELLRSVQQTQDGGYILGGRSFSDSSGTKTQNNKGDWDQWVVKLDAGGNVQWDKTFGANSFDDLLLVKQMQDGGFVLGGYSISDSSGDKTENNIGLGDFWVVKLDANGSKQWDKTLGGRGDDFPTSLQQTSDRGYVMGGRSNSYRSNDKTENSRGGFDYWIVKFFHEEAGAGLSTLQAPSVAASRMFLDRSPSQKEAVTETVAIPNVLRRSQIWRIPALPATNRVMVYDVTGKLVWAATNYANNKAFTSVASGLYFYAITVKDEQGKEKNYKGKLLIGE